MKGALFPLVSSVAVFLALALPGMLMYCNYNVPHSYLCIYCK